MIETSFDCEKFKLENVDGDWFMHIIPVEEDNHPVINSPSILFIRNILTGKTYYFAFNHPDSIPIVTYAWFVQRFLLNDKKKKWVIDKKAFTQLIGLPNVYDVNLANYLIEFLILKE